LQLFCQALKSAVVLCLERERESEREVEGEKAQSLQRHKGCACWQIYSRIYSIEHIVLTRQSFVSHTQSTDPCWVYKEVLTSEMIWSTRRKVTMGKVSDQTVSVNYTDLT